MHEMKKVDLFSIYVKHFVYLVSYFILRIKGYISVDNEMID